MSTESSELLGRSSRVLSIDLFRGVVMLFLIAEATGLYDLLISPALAGTFIYRIGLQFQHHPWNGLRLWDLGQPFFMFISGAAMHFSYRRRREQGERWGTSLIHALKRALLLFSLGWAIYRIVPVEDNPHGAFLYDVLPQLALASLIAFLLLRRPLSQQLAISFGLIAMTEFLYPAMGRARFRSGVRARTQFRHLYRSSNHGGTFSGHWAVFNVCRLPPSLSGGPSRDDIWTGRGSHRARSAQWSP